MAVLAIANCQVAHFKSNGAPNARSPTSNRPNAPRAQLKFDETMVLLMRSSWSSLVCRVRVRLGLTRAHIGRLTYQWAHFAFHARSSLFR